MPCYGVGIALTDNAIASSNAADVIDKLAPPYDSSASDEYNGYKSLSSFLWHLWTIVSGLGRLVPHDAEHPGQATIVEILVKLGKHDRGTIQIWAGDPLRLWDDLPLFAQRMVEISDSPAIDDDFEPLTEHAARHWRNQCAFMARCLDGEVAGWDDYALVALSSALERDNWTSALHLRCELLAATEWVIYSGPTLLSFAEQNDHSKNSGDYGGGDGDGDGNSSVYNDDIPSGPLFSGPDGLSVQRWDFWRARFTALLDQSKTLLEQKPHVDQGNEGGDVSLSQHMTGDTGNAMMTGPSVHDPRGDIATKEARAYKEAPENFPVPAGTLVDEVCTAIMIAIERMVAAEAVVAAMGDIKNMESESEEGE
ncbi:hypothetical protein SBRCBS47491_009423 [Sporothrix bragantina]|uniref:Nuclear pore complex protein Nup85 n=1 Tax=Sporothrix bragantina TaxID=671064 RepID=A0ABP0CW80_9PEZI